MKKEKEIGYSSLNNNILSVLLKEPFYQLYPPLPISEKTDENKSINVVSLFSGCGGMDLGFEGGFTVHKESISQAHNPDFIESLG